MQVLHIIKAKGIAGAERHLLTLLPALRERGVDARLLLLVERAYPQDELIALCEAAGVPVESRIMARHLDASLLPWLIRHLRAARPALVHAHLAHAQLYAIPAAKLAGVPVITGHHNDDPFIRRFPFRPVFRQLWGRTDGGIAISEAVAAFCREIEGDSAQRLRIVQYGMNVGEDDAQRRTVRASYRSSLGVGERQIIVGCVGRLIEQKGITYALHAFAQVRERFPEALLVIIGDGGLRTSLEAETAALGIESQVRFLGWQPDAAMWMNAFDIFLLPSLWEGFGLVLLEAMAACLPIIASRVSAIPEVIVDGETGILVESQAVEALREALATMLADAPLRRHMGLLGRDRLETVFSVAAMTDQTIRVYNEILVDR